ncbi:MAG: DUF4163 domain-containing protein [Flavobacteriaceae bacterium]
MKSSIFLVCISLFLTACTKEESLVFSGKKYEKTSEFYNGDRQAKVTIDIPFAISENTVSDSINTAIYQFVEEIIYLDKNQEVFSSYEELAHSFIASFEELKKEYPDEIGWEADIKGKITFQTEKLLNIKIEYYMFTGGAHGYFGVKSLFFDAETGENLTTQDLFLDLQKLEVFAEQKFRNDFHIAEGHPINSTGFMFEDDVFHLPENVFFTDQGLLFYYNIYEISSYADGHQSFVISYDKADLFLKKSYKPIFKNL